MYVVEIHHPPSTRPRVPLTPGTLSTPQMRLSKLLVQHGGGRVPLVAHAALTARLPARVEGGVAA